MKYIQNLINFKTFSSVKIKSLVILYRHTLQSGFIFQTLQPEPEKNIKYSRLHANCNQRDKNQWVFKGEKWRYLRQLNKNTLHWFIPSHTTGSPALIPQNTIHSYYSFVLSLWLCSDKVCPHATDFRLRVTYTSLISWKLSKAGWPNSEKNAFMYTVIEINQLDGT